MFNDNLNRRVQAIIPDRKAVWNYESPEPPPTETIFGYIVERKGYNWQDQDIVVFYTIRLDDGTYVPGIYEDDVTMLNVYSDTDYAEEYAELGTVSA